MAKTPNKSKGKTPSAGLQTSGAAFPVAGRGQEADLDPGEGPPRTNDDGGYSSGWQGEIPDGFESEAEFLSAMLREYQLDFNADRHNIEQAMEDLRFLYVDQWDEKTRADREREGRPCITINTLPQFVGQVVGDRRINKTQIKIVAKDQSKVKVAEIRSGLIKSIENHSRAEVIYDQCCEDQVGCGVSNYEVTLENSPNNVFTRDIFFRSLPNPFAVVWDRFSRDPTGRDARRCWVEETIDRKEYEREYPNQPIPDSFMLDFDMPNVGFANFGSWVDGNDVKLVAYWRLVEKPAKFALMADGQVEDVTDKDESTYIDRLYVDPVTNEAYVKDGVRTYAQRWLVTSFAILDGPYELPLSRLPIIKVSGRIGRVGLKQYRFGLVRWARDASLLRNYWRSVVAEKLAMAPRAQWIADFASVKGREQDWRDAHLNADPLLVYNTGKSKPERVDPAPLDAAIINESNMNAQDIKDVTGLHDASLGIRSNEVSGKAIMARQREGDVATVTFHDHLNLAIQEGGDVANQLIGVGYDTVRIIRTIGVDDAIAYFKVNDPNDAESPDITQGEFDTEITTGPSYTTQRQEGAELLLEMAKVNPALFEVAGDVIMETQDIPGGQRIADRLRRVLPAAQQEEEEKRQKEAEASGQPVEPSPQEQQAQQMQEMQAQLAQMQIQLQIKQMEAEVAKAEAEAVKAQAEAAQAQAGTALNDADVRVAQANADKAEADARAAEAKADEAESKAIMAGREVQFHRAERAVEIHQKANPPKPNGGSSKNRAGGSRSAGGSRPGKARA